MNDDKSKRDEPVSDEPAAAPSPTLVAQAEAVFESYLAARVVNARRELAAAKTALLSDSRSSGKFDAVRRAEANLEKLQAQLVEQKRNAARARAGHPVNTPVNDASHLPAQFGDPAAAHERSRK